MASSRQQEDEEYEEIVDPVTGQLVRCRRARSRNRRASLSREMTGSAVKVGESPIAHGEKGFHGKFKNKDAAPDLAAAIDNVPSGRASRWHGHNPVVPDQPAIEGRHRARSKGKKHAITKHINDGSAERQGRSPLHHSTPQEAAFHAPPKGTSPPTDNNASASVVAGAYKEYHAYDPVNNAPKGSAAPGGGRRGSLGKVFALTKNELGTTGDRDQINIVAGKSKDATKFEATRRNQELVTATTAANAASQKSYGHASKWHDHNPVVPDRQQEHAAPYERPGASSMSPRRASLGEQPIPKPARSPVEVNPLTGVVKGARPSQQKSSSGRLSRDQFSM